MFRLEGLAPNRVDSKVGSATASERNPQVGDDATWLFELLAAEYVEKDLASYFTVEFRYHQKNAALRC